MRTLIIAIILMVIAIQAHATDVKFQWDANTESDLAGYRLYQKQDSATPPFSKVLDVSKDTTTTTILNLDSTHSHSFAVTAYNSAGVESGYSNIVTIPAAPAVPGNLKWTITLTVSGQ